MDLHELARKNLGENVRTNFIEIDGVFLPEEYKLFAEAVDKFNVFNDDVWVCSFQKSGTTWTQEMVWCIANNLDFKGASVPINERFPFLEFSGIITTARIALRNPDLEAPKWVRNSIDYCDNLPRPRFIKCHQPFNLLPAQIRTGEKKPKIIYVARHPKDVCISFYHHSKLLEGYCGSFDDFCKQFLGDKVVYAPYWGHVNGFWERRHQSNILFIKFEDMKKDLPSVIRKTATFLGKTLTDQQIETLCDHLSFAKMETNSALNRESSIAWLKKCNPLGNSVIVEGKFMRNGNVGQWRSSMSEEINKKFEDWIEKNAKCCDGLTF